MKKILLLAVITAALSCTKCTNPTSQTHCGTVTAVRVCQVCADPSKYIVTVYFYDIEETHEFVSDTLIKVKQQFCTDIFFK